MKPKRTILAVACSVTLAFGCVASERGDTQPTQDAPPVLHADDSIPPQHNRILKTTHSYSGVVCGVGPDWIELAVGWKRANEVWAWHPDGSQTLISREEYDNSKPKRFSTSRTRPSGDLNCEPFLPASVPQETHLVSDVLIGDSVFIWTGVTREGEEWLMQLSIYRRHGGQIPPMHGDHFQGMSLATHLRYQAEQDWEEKGIPIPKEYLDSHGRYPGVNPPDPPVAPEPRAAKAKP